MTRDRRIFEAGTGCVKVALTMVGRQGNLDAMPATLTPPSAFATITPRSGDHDFGRLFGDPPPSSHEPSTQMRSRQRSSRSPESPSAWVRRSGGRSGSRRRAGSDGELEQRAGTASPAIDPPRSFTLFGIREERPGPRWQALFTATWPAYRAWYLQDGDDARPDLATARAQLTRHMPELVSTWEAMVALTGDDEVAARMLTMWDAPRFAPGCSQAAQVGSDPILVRNYDYSPDLFEWVVYSSEFTGRRVIGTSDCLWGLLDGMNDDGLVISLTHGGRPELRPRVRDPPGRALPAGGRRARSRRHEPHSTDSRSPRRTT